jgi:hypothetical protein
MGEAGDREAADRTNGNPPYWEDVSGDALLHVIMDIRRPICNISFFEDVSGESFNLKNQRRKTNPLTSSLL